MTPREVKYHRIKTVIKNIRTGKYAYPKIVTMPLSPFLKELERIGKDVSDEARLNFTPEGSYYVDETRGYEVKLSGDTPIPIKDLYQKPPQQSENQ